MLTCCYGASPFAVSVFVVSVETILATKWDLKPQLDLNTRAFTVDAFSQMTPGSHPSPLCSLSFPK